MDAPHPDPGAMFAGNDDIQQYLGLVYGVCRRVLRQSSDVDDAVQETFIKFASRGDQIRTNPSSWLHSCAHTTALDVAKRLRSRERRRQPIGDAEATAGGIHASEDSRVRHVDACLVELSDVERSVLVSYFFADKTMDAIAVEAGLSKSAVKKRLDRALESLRTKLQRRGVMVAGLLGAMLVDLRAEQGEVPAALAKSAGDAYRQALAARPVVSLARSSGIIAGAAAAAGIMIAIGAAFVLNGSVTAEDLASPLVPSRREVSVLPDPVASRTSARTDASADSGLIEKWTRIGGLPGSIGADSISATIDPEFVPLPAGGSIGGFHDGKFTFSDATIGVMTKTRIDAASTAVQFSLEFTVGAAEVQPESHMVLHLSRQGLAQDFISVHFDSSLKMLMWSSRDHRDVDPTAQQTDLFASDAPAALQDPLDRLDLASRTGQWQGPSPDYRIRCSRLMDAPPGRYRVVMRSSPGGIDIAVNGEVLFTRETMGPGDLNAYAFVYAPVGCPPGVATIERISLNRSPIR
ncbi:MAG: sigma-70 family RNA polymerase sigma factor [Planctomycetes bacterium]|nr:sigma-70 family RNA polymerase sigma factor [Planctomycetota bacterium]